jgi:hypothetical protein
MTGLNFQNGIKDLLKLTSAIIKILVAAFLFTSCTNTQQPYKMVKFFGKGSVMNYSKELNLVMYYSDSIRPAVLLVGNEDLISLDDEILHLMTDREDSLAFENIKGTGYINGRISSIRISEKDSTGSILKGLLEKDISSLELLLFESAVPEKCIPLLADLSKIKPDLSLSFESPFPGLKAILKLFHPKILLISVITADILKDLPGLASPEILVAGFDSSVTGPLPAFPSLKRIILAGSENKSLPPDFFSENPQIENISFFSIKYIDFAQLRPLTALKELFVNDADSLVNQTRLSDHESLEMLAVLSEKFIYDSTLDGLKNIRWITFSPSTGQKEFDRFIAKHPSLEVVEIINNENINGLQSLSSLRNLYGLIVLHQLRDTVSPSSFKNLRYLSLPSDYLKDSSKYNDLKRSLPNTVVVPNDGFCLGSGWLLLLVPLIALFRYFSPKKRN